MGGKSRKMGTVSSKLVQKLKNQQLQKKKEKPVEKLAGGLLKK